ncbi:MAG: phage head-tail connector protein [Pseudomonadota bacterium]
MQRTVITPADFSGSALDDLKSWLGISRPKEDALLRDLLAASASLCEAFTGQSPLEQTVEETVPSETGRYALLTRPAQSLVAAHILNEDGSRIALDPAEYEFSIDHDFRACIELEGGLEARSIVVSIRAGIAPDWAAMPEALKQGIIRLAAFHYRDRETGRDAEPPASVAALWRPWRTLRLS